jgi:hypothetical protein
MTGCAVLPYLVVHRESFRLPAKSEQRENLHHPQALPDPKQPNGCKGCDRRSGYPRPPGSGCGRKRAIGDVPCCRGDHEIPSPTTPVPGPFAHRVHHRLRESPALPGEAGMHDRLRCRGLDEFKRFGRRIEVVEQPLAAAE